MVPIIYHLSPYRCNQQLLGSRFRSLQVDSRRIGALVPVDASDMLHLTPKKNMKKCRLVRPFTF